MSNDSLFHLHSVVLDIMLANGNIVISDKSITDWFVGRYHEETDIVGLVTTDKPYGDLYTEKFSTISDSIVNELLTNHEDVVVECKLIGLTDINEAVTEFLLRRKRIEYVAKMKNIDLMKCAAKSEFNHKDIEHYALKYIVDILGDDVMARTLLTGLTFQVHHRMFMNVMLTSGRYKDFVAYMRKMKEQGEL